MKMLMCLAYHVAEEKIEGDSKRGEDGDGGNTDPPPQLQSVDCDANGAARHSPSHNNSMGGNLIAAFSEEDLQSLGIEYELTDYILLNDIEEEIHSQRSFHSLNSNNSLSSIDPPYTIDAPSSSEDDLTYSDAATSTKLSKQHSRLSSKSSNISKHNFDDLFEIRDSWMTNNGSSLIGSQWEGVAFDAETRDDCADAIVKGEGLELQGSSYTSAEEKGDPTTYDTHTSPTNNGVVGSNESESAEILKHLVIKCLVRNNYRGGVSGVKGGKIPRGVADSSTRVTRGGTKFMTSYGPPDSLPRDPSIVSHTSSRFHGREDPTNKRQSEDPPDSEEMKREHQYEQMQIYMMNRAHGNHMVVGSGMHQHNNGGSSVVSNGSRQYPPRSDIVRYGNNIGNNTIDD